MAEAAAERREAGASLQTLYRYYGGKEALLNTCLHRWLGELAEQAPVLFDMLWAAISAEQTARQGSPQSA